MPKPTGTLHNCWRVSMNNRLVGYVATELLAELLRDSVKAVAADNAKFHIEPWFIEGEF